MGAPGVRVFDPSIDRAIRSAAVSFSRPGHRRNRSRQPHRMPGRRCAAAPAISFAGRTIRPSRSSSTSLSQRPPLRLPREGRAPRRSSRVTAAVSKYGPAWISTSAMTPSASIDSTRPGMRLRADMRAPVRWRSGMALSRRTSPAGTRRRLSRSRWVRSFPARSQRRRVSTLTPIARAASPSVRSFSLAISTVIAQAPGYRCRVAGQALSTLPDPLSVARVRSTSQVSPERRWAGARVGSGWRRRPAARL